MMTAWSGCSANACAIASVRVVDGTQAASAVGCLPAERLLGEGDVAQLRLVQRRE